MSVPRVKMTILEALGSYTCVKLRNVIFPKRDVLQSFIGEKRDFLLLDEDGVNLNGA